jgi:hypothetical protein
VLVELRMLPSFDRAVGCLPMAQPRALLFASGGKPAVVPTAWGRSAAVSTVLFD